MSPESRPEQGASERSLDGDLLELADDSADVWQAAGARLKARGAAAVPILERGLGDDRLGSVAHWRMLLVLRELRLEETVPLIRAALRRALSRRDSTVIQGAMEALAVFETPEALGELLALLEHDEPDVVKHAAALAGQIGGARAAEALLRLLQSEVASIRYSAASALAGLEDSGVRAALQRQLRVETDPDVREVLRRALSHD